MTELSTALAGSPFECAKARSSSQLTTAIGKRAASGSTDIGGGAAGAGP
jgi:hypothetical protein